MAQEKTQFDEVMERFDKIEKAIESLKTGIEAIAKKVGVGKKGLFED